MKGGLHRGRCAVVLQDRGLPRFRCRRETLLKIQPVEHGATMESAATEGKHLLDFAERESRCASRIVAVDVWAVSWIGGEVLHASRLALSAPHCTAAHRHSADQFNGFAA